MNGTALKPAVCDEARHLWTVFVIYLWRYGQGYNMRTCTTS